MKHKTIILEGIMQKIEAYQHHGRIYPPIENYIHNKNPFVTEFGGDLYAKFGATDEELIYGYEIYAHDFPDPIIRAKALLRIIEIRINKLITKQL